MTSCENVAGCKHGKHVAGCENVTGCENVAGCENVIGCDKVKVVISMCREQ